MATRVAALVAALDRAGIPHCHWKGRAALAAGLRGERDLDLLVPAPAFAAAEQALSACGFLHACSRFASDPPGTAHHYAYEPGQERLLHVHLHDAVLTGEDWITSHALPLADAMLASPEFVEGVRVPTPALEAALTVAKHAIRWGSLPDRLASRLRPKDERAALAALLQDGPVREAAAILAAACPAWGRDDVLACARVLREGGSDAARRSLAGRARRALAPFRTESGRHRAASYARFFGARVRRLLDGDRPDKGVAPAGRTLVFTAQAADAAQAAGRWLGQAFAHRQLQGRLDTPRRAEILLLVDARGRTAIEIPPDLDAEALRRRVWEALLTPAEVG